MHLKLGNGRELTPQEENKPLRRTEDDIVTYDPDQTVVFYHIPGRTEPGEFFFYGIRINLMK